MEVIRMENYVKALLRPNGSKPKGRRVWSVDLESVWLPFFTATNTMGDTNIAHDALGAPLRLAYDKDGSVKFSPNTGRPVIRVAKELQDSVKLVRENFVAGLLAYAHEAVTENPEGYREQVEANLSAGQPITDKDRQAHEDALAELIAETRPKAKPKAKAEAEKEAVGATA